MIKRPTVIVVGAGGSINYKLPSSTELRKKIVNFISPGSGRPKKIAEWTGVSETDLQDFARQLHNSRTDTIDSWLATNPQYVELGKACICHVIGNHENPGNLFEGWYQDIWNIMKEGVRSVDDFVNFNKLSFVTFNYDRSLEEFLYQAMKNYFLGVPEDKILESIRAVKIVHVHGQNGYLPWQVDVNNKQVIRPYSISSEFDEKSWKIAKNCSQHILTSYIGAGMTGTSLKIETVMNYAHDILFAGFGYDPENLRKIQSNNGGEQKVYGMYHSTTFRRRQSIENYNLNGFARKIELVPNDSISEFLRNHLDF